jgi:hypothetical protein
MTSFIAACGSGRSTNVIPAVPAAWSVTTIVFIVHLLAESMSPSSEVLQGEFRIAVAESGNLSRNFRPPFDERVMNEICR